MERDRARWRHRANLRDSVFTAPTTLGEYLVIATSAQDPSVTGVATVNVGGACSWSLSIGGGHGGTWSGELAGHSYPDEPLGGGNFTMTFQRSRFDDYPIGTVWAVGGPGAGVNSGSWPANFSFSLTEGSTWGAVVAPGETNPPLLVSSNDGTTVIGSVSGTAILSWVDGGQSEPASFTFRFRSAHNNACGPDGE